jgi:hypothetical protein
MILKYLKLQKYNWRWRSENRADWEKSIKRRRSVFNCSVIYEEKEEKEEEEKEEDKVEEEKEEEEEEEEEEGGGGGLFQVYNFIYPT